jgi:uncharacterized membrane protein HdeD (DUF308 family)
MEYQEVKQNNLLYETLPVTVKDICRNMLWKIIWGLLIDIVLIIAYGVAIFVNIVRSLKRTIEETKSNVKPKLNSVFWITLVRGLLVIVLGASLLFTPEKTKAMLFNFMGFFWLLTGLVSIRQELHKRGNKLVLAAGILGVLAGIAVVTRDLSRQYLAEFWVVTLLGIVILLSGILHILGGFQIGGRSMQGRTTLSIMLGIFEVFLGGVFIIFQGGQSQIVYGIAIGWALIGGVLLLSDAYRQYRTSTENR